MGMMSAVKNSFFCIRPLTSYELNGFDSNRQTVKIAEFHADEILEGCCQNRLTFQLMMCYVNLIVQKPASTHRSGLTMRIENGYLPTENSEIF
jgi:hypothetical protein